MDSILTIQNLSKHFAGITAVDNVNLTIVPQSIIGLYGDNGAGKTTLFNLISGFEKPDAGSITFMERNITHKSVLHRAQMGMGRLFQNPRVFTEMSVLDNLMAASKHTTGHHLLNYITKHGIIREEENANYQKAMSILQQFSLNTKSNLNSYELSVGERKLLSLGCLLMNDSKFILLDELSSGLNSLMIDRLHETITDLNKSGITFMMIEHDLPLISSICNEKHKIDNGKISRK
ncbi:MAG: ATP-binding cassette domain-containing protein [Paludibacter sp.]